MSVKKRFMKHLEDGGHIPKGYAHGGYSAGDTESDEWVDDDWNDHEDTSGEPMMYLSGGGMVAESNYPKPGAAKQGKDLMSEEEVRKHMARAIHARKKR